MRLVFVNPTLEWEKNLFRQAVPLGIAYLASVLEERGHAVSLYDARFHDGDISDILPLDADIIGFTVMTFQFRHVLAICKALRGRGYKGRIIAGGPHPSAKPDECMQAGVFDALFVGESEESILRYLEYLSGRLSVSGLIRTYIREGDTVLRGEADTWIRDLDALPFPARHLFPEDRFEGEASRHINLISSRGCPYQCTFCQPLKTTLFGQKIRRRSVESVIEEIRFCIGAFSVDNIGFVDDTFTFNKRYLHDFCNRMIQEDLGITWGCQTRSDLDKESLELMKASGCTSFWVGIESASQRVLNAMDKHSKVEKNELFMQRCKEVGIEVLVNMMVGFPGETEKDRELSVSFIRRHKPSQVFVSQVTPFPGTYIAERDDVIEQDDEYTARHVFTPKFASMESAQESIIKAARDMSYVYTGGSALELYRDDIEAWLNTLSFDTTPLYIFGTGMMGEFIHHLLQQKGKEVKAFLDTYSTGSFLGLPVLSPSVSVFPSQVILASLTHHITMRKQLEESGFPGERIFSFF